MDAVVLAGGLGTRLRDAVAHVPKALAPVAGSPFLDHLVPRLLASGVIGRIILAVGYLSEQIVSYYEKSPWPLTFSIEEKPLGTGGAIKRAQALVRSPLFFVLNGDTASQVDLKGMLASHRGLATLAYRESNDEKRYGGLTIENDRVTGFCEKGEGARFISVGTYLFDRTLEFPSQEVFSLEEDFFPTLTDGHLGAFPSSGLFIDIGTPVSFHQAQRIFT